MGHYIANSENSRNFNLASEGREIGELIYQKWYSFTAEIIMADGAKFTLEPKGFWESKIELKDDSKTLLEFKMGWKGIIIKTLFNDREENFLLKLKGLLSNKFILIDTDNIELMVAETDFKWSKFNFDYTIETTPNFDNFDRNELLLMAILHCINYYLTIIIGAA
ncbi:MAG: hypothetical protein U0X91_29540 [Spirosomataceae bacterium]